MADVTAQTGSHGLSPDRKAGYSPRFHNQFWFFLLAVSLPAGRMLFFDPDRQMTAATFLFSMRGALLCAMIGLAAIAFHTAWQKHSLSGTVEHLARAVLTPRNLVYALPGIAAVSLFINGFASFKETIPAVNPYWLDPLFMEMDRLVHFGWHPWEALAAVMDYGTITVMLDRAYYLWFPVVFGATATVALLPGDNRQRDRYLLSFVACWLFIGVGMATAMSSVGPIFYDQLEGGPSPFTALLAKLEAVNAQSPLQAIAVRDTLWANYLNPDGGVITGISAMPSMHNALCVLLVLAARHVGRIAQAAAITFAVVIFIGSVHLGWHYAIDAYVSAVAVAAIWVVAGRIVGAPRKTTTR